MPMDLSTTYMGLKLDSPLVPSSSPLTGDVEQVRRLADGGAGAIVLPSLFEEQVRHDADELDHYLQYGAERFPESLSYFPDLGDYKFGPEQYLDHVRAVKDAVDVPVIASLNGVSAKGWTEYAAKMADAGADAVELNVYYIPTDPDLTGAQVEDVYVNILRAVKSGLTVPVAMKLSPYFSSTANVLSRLDQAGADGLVLFNRFYQPDIDLDDLSVSPNLVLSSPVETRLPMRWIAIMRGRLDASLAATSGVHSGRDAAKMLLVGADAVMVCSALLENGVDHLAAMRDELAEVMEAREYAAVSDMKGVLSQENCPEPAAFERANYMKTLNSYGRTMTME